MNQEPSLGQIFVNTFDGDYSLEDAAADLGHLILELEREEGTMGENTERAAELRKLISVQEKLALSRFRDGNPVALPNNQKLKVLD
jgi:hypothetical protein